jgi:hypothetical protein
MLVSFSHDRMLPWVRRGIVDVRFRLHHEVHYQTAHLDRMGERVKRQTIRAAYDKAGRATKWHDVEAGCILHLWWKSRRPEREHLGNVDLGSISPIWLRNHKGDLFHGNGFAPDRGGHRDDFFWLSDGFLTEGEALNYFCPREGEAFLGFLLRW